MKKAEMKVVRFGSEDVIATSGIKLPRYLGASYIGLSNLFDGTSGNGQIDFYARDDISDRRYLGSYTMNSETPLSAIIEAMNDNLSGNEAVKAHKITENMHVTYDYKGDELDCFSGWATASLADLFARELNDTGDGKLQEGYYGIYESACADPTWSVFNSDFSICSYDEKGGFIAFGPPVTY